MSQSKLNINTCYSDLDDFKNLLDSKEEIEETIFLNFFKDRPNLILLIGNLVYNFSPSLYQNEFNLFNEFYADFAVANSKKNQFVFIEFEDAKKDSIFVSKENLKTIRYEWATKYEHGYSQIINWFYRLDDYSRTNKIAEHFGVEDISYTGLLIIGREKFIQETSLKNRFDWRNNEVDINKKQVYCYTYDGFYEELREKLDIINEFKNQE